MSAFFVGSALPSFAARDLNIKNDTESFLFVSGTTGNVGIGTAVPVSELDIKAGVAASPKIISVDGTFADLTTTKTGLYVDVTASVAGNRGATGTWSEIRTTADSGTYSYAIAGVYGEVLHSGAATADFLMGSIGLVNNMGSGNITNAYGFYPQIWKGAGDISHAYGMYYQGVPDVNGDTGTDLGGDVINQYGIGIRRLTEATTRNIGILLDDTTEGATTAGNFSIYEETGYPNYFTGNIGIGTTSPEAKLALHSTGTTLVDSHVNEDTTGAGTVESHYAVGQSGEARTTPSDVQNFRFFFGGFDQEVARISMNTPSMAGATAIGAMDVYTQGAAGTLVRGMTLDEHKAMFAPNVGIGTSEPEAKLHVGDDGSGPDAMSITGSDAYIKGNLEVDGKIYGDGSALTGISGAIMGLTATRVPVASSPTTLVDSVIYAVGANIGIGTSNPSYPMEIRRSTVGTTLYVGNDGFNQGGPSALVVYDGRYTFGFGWNSNIHSAGLQQDNNGLHITVDGTLERNILLRPAGNVGINTVLPYSKLEIVGIGTTSGTRNFLIRDSAKNPLVTVLDNGNVGIGNITPRAKLQIDTSSSSSEIALLLTGEYYQPVNGLHDSGLMILPGVNRAGNRQLWIGSSDSIGQATRSVFRYDVAGTAIASIDAVTGTGSTRLPVNLGGNNDGMAGSDVSVGAPALAYNVTLPAKLSLYGEQNKKMFVIRAPASGVQNYFEWQNNAGTALGVIDIQGNLGVGTTESASKLDVVGSAHVLSSAETANIGYATTPGSLYVQQDLEVDGNVYLGDLITDSLIVAGSLTLAGSTNYAGPVSISTTDTTAFVVRQQTAGTQVFNVDTQSGNVGVGTAAPRALLEVGAGATIPAGSSPAGLVEGNLVVDGTVYATLFLGQLELGMTTGSVVFEGPAGMTEDNANFFWDDTNNRLGIGTTQPGVGIPYGVTKLHVYGRDDQGNSLVIENNGSTGLLGAELGLKTSGAIRGKGITFYDTESRDAWGAGVPYANADKFQIGYVPDYTAQGVWQQTATFYETTALLTIRASGNVGIGTHLPVARLHVSADNSAPDAMPITGSDLFVKGNIEFDGKIYGDGSMLSGVNSISGLNTGYITRAGSATTIVDSVIYQDGSNNVGIGVINPSQRLFVSGNMMATGTIYGWNGNAVLANNYISSYYAGLTRFGNSNVNGYMSLMTANVDRVTIDLFGNIGIGTATPVARLHVGDIGSVPDAMSITGMDAYIEGNLEVDGRIYGDGSSLTGITAANPTANNVPKSNGTALIDSSIYEVAGNIGIGTIGPTAKLELLPNTGATDVGLQIKQSYITADLLFQSLIVVKNKDDNDVFMIESRGLDGATRISSAGAWSTLAAFDNLGYRYLTSTGAAQSMQARLIVLGDTYSLDTSGLTSNTIYGDVGLGDNLILQSTTHATKGSVLINPTSGNVGIGTTASAARLHVGPGTPDAMNITGNDVYVAGNLEVDGRIYGDGSGLTGISGAISGLTPTRVPVALNSTTLVDSVIYEVGGNMGIGTAAPRKTLSVIGKVNIGGDEDPVLDAYDLVDKGANAGLYLWRTSNVAGQDPFILLRSGSAGTYGGQVRGLPANQGLRFTDMNGADTYMTIRDANVGIGTTTPVARLHVGDAGSAPDTMSITGNDVYVAGNLEVDGRIYGDGSGLTGISGISGLTAARIPVASSPTTLVDSLIYQVGGAIGIGTSVPQSFLDINGSVKISGNFAIQASANGGVTIDSYNSSFRENYLQLYGAAGGKISSTGTGDLSIGDGNTDVNVFIKSDGNVGIGTILPAARLHIADTGSVPDAMSITGMDAYIEGNLEVDGRIYGDGSGLTGISGAISGLTATRVPVASSGTTLVDSIIYEVSGNIGIGTAVPRRQLDVEGSIRLGGVQNGIIGPVNSWIGFYMDTGVALPVKVGTLAITNDYNDVAPSPNGLYVKGNVGIGTSMPLATLDAVGAGTTSATSSLVLRDATRAIKVAVNDNGYVGIGTSTAQSPLEVKGASIRINDPNAFLAFYDGIAGNGNAHIQYITGTGLLFRNYQNTPIIFRPLDTEAVRITSSRNVGIGTSVPRALLEVGTAATVPAGSSPAEIIKGDLVVDGRIYGDGSGLTGISGAISGLTATRVPVALNSTTLVDSIIYEVSGNIGIGITNPDSPFTVYGTGINTVAEFRNNSNNIAYINITDTSTGSGTYNGLVLGYNGQAMIHNRENTSMVFSTNDISRMLISNTGGVSIGTTFIGYNPGAGSLIVQGNIGVGTTAPIDRLHIVETNAPSRVVVEQWGNNATAPGFDYRKARGVTGGSSVADGDFAGLFSYQAYDGDQYLRTAHIAARVSGTVANNSIPTDLIFSAGATDDPSVNNEIMRIKAAGNVGLGTNTPLAKLHIGDAGSAPNAMSITGMDAYIEGNLEVDGRIYGDGSGLTGISGISGLTATNIPVASSPTTLVDSVVYNVGANVGIGTTDPLAALQVVGRIRASSLIYSGQSYLGENNLYGFTDYAVQAAGDLTLHTNSSNIIFNLGGSNERMRLTSSGNLGIGTSEPTASLEIDETAYIHDLFRVNDSGPGDASPFVIDATGNVGIGTFLPENKVTIEGNVGIDGRIGSGEDYGHSGVSAGTTYLELYNGLTGDTTLWNDQDFSMIFGVNDAEVMRLRAGNIGIGTATPVAKVHVGDTGSVPNAMSITGMDAYIEGNLEVDGRIYGDGSGLTGISGAISGLTATRVPVASNSTTIVDSGIYYVGGNVGIGTSAPVQELDLVGDIHLQTTTSDDTGVIYKNGVVFIHDFHHPTGDTAVPNGYNIFIGENAGNFMTGSTATSTSQASGNTAVGRDTLHAITTGYGNAAFGSGVLYDNTTGHHNASFGVNSLSNNDTGFDNTAIGFASLGNNTSGSANVAVGKYAGLYIADGSTARTTGSNNLFLGADTRALANDDSNEIVIGPGATGIGSNAIVLGNDSITKTYLKGNVGVGTAEPVAKLHVGNAGSVPNAMSITGSDVYIAGNLEVDGRIYGDGSGLTGISGAISGLTATRVPVASNSTTIVDSGIYYVGANVGIGTSAPVQTLEVAGGIAASGGGDSYFTGSVGIGTAVPLSTLDVEGTLNATGAVTLGSTLGVTGNLDVNGAANDIAGTLNLSGNALTSTGALTVTPGAGTNMNIALSGAGDLAVNTSQLYVDTATGNIGVGTAVSFANLHVGGSGSAPDLMPSTGDDLYVLGNIEFDGRIYGDGSGLTGLSGSISGLTATRVPVASGSTTIVDSGIYYVGNNVGISSTAPSAMLDVAGTTHLRGASGITGLYVDPSGNVGIGNNNPIFKVVSSGHIYAQSSYMMADDGFSAYVQDSGVLSFSSGGPTLARSANDALPAFIISNTHASATGDLLQLRNATSTPFTVLNNGNVGIGTTVPRVKLELGNDGAILAIGTTSSGWLEPNMGAGTRMLWYPRKAAFRAGSVNGTQWDESNIGSYSAAMGGYTTASGAYSAAFGRSTIASNNQTTAFGFSTTASAQAATSMGHGSTASGYASTSMGYYTQANNYANVALGRYNVGGGDTANWVAADSIFEIGIGADVSNRANAVTVLKNGNVGIGTNLPLVKLHVATDTAVPNVMPITGSDLYVRGNIEFDGRIYGDGSGLTNLTSSQWTTVGNDIYYDTGNVGISTTVPSAKLNILTNNIGATSTDTQGIFLQNTTPATAVITSQYSPALVFSSDVWNDAGSSNANSRWKILNTPQMVSGQTQYDALDFQLNRNGGGYASAMALGYSSNGGYSATFSGRLTAGSTFETADEGTTITRLMNNTPGTVLSINQEDNTGLTRGIYITPTGTITSDWHSLEWSNADGYGLYGAGTAPSYLAGNIGLGTTLSRARLEVGAAAIIPSGSSPEALIKGNFVVDGKIYGDGSGLTGLPGSISGLTATRVPVASGSTTIVDSIIYEVSGNIGIGTPTPVSAFHVIGRMRGGIRGTAANNKAPVSSLAIFDNTNGNSSTYNPGINNVGLYFENDGASDGYYVFEIANQAGKTFGVANSGRTTITSASGLLSHQFEVGYDSTHYWGMNVSSTGKTVFSLNNNIDVMTFAVNGNIGIGTTEPRGLLEVDAGVYSTPFIVTSVGNLGLGTTLPRASLEVGTAAVIPSGSSPAEIVKGNLVVDGRIYGDGSGLTGITGSSQWTTSGSNIYYNTGNVGIGTTAPAGKMEAVGQYFSRRYPATTSVNWANGNTQYLQLVNGVNAISFTGGQPGGRYLLELIQPSGGAAGTVTWDTNVRWANATAPTLTATNSQIDITTFYYNGTNYVAAASLNYDP